MRLTPEEIDAIKAAATDVFGATAVVRLFGSRLSDARRGGDVDLHFEIDGPVPDYRSQSRFLDAVDATLEGKKVDLIFSPRGAEIVGFERIAYRDGAVL